MANFNTGNSNCNEPVTAPVGPKGDKGEKGDQGDIGIQGPKGDQGDQGLQGDLGQDGTDGGVGPQGPQGIQGVIGLTGDQGDIGLTGPQGDQGIQGIQGIQGVDGPAGPSGDISFESTPTIVPFVLGGSLLLEEFVPTTIPSSPILSSVIDINKSTSLKVGNTYFININILLSVTSTIGSTPSIWRIKATIPGGPDTVSIDSISVAKTEVFTGGTTNWQDAEQIEEISGVDEQYQNLQGFLEGTAGDTFIITPYLRGIANQATSQFRIQGQIIMPVNP